MGNAASRSSQKPSLRQRAMFYQQLPDNIELSQCLYQDAQMDPDPPHLPPLIQDEPPNPSTLSVETIWKRSVGKIKTSIRSFGKAKEASVQANVHELSASSVPSLEALGKRPVRSGRSSSVEAIKSEVVTLRSEDRDRVQSSAGPSSLGLPSQSVDSRPPSFGSRTQSVVKSRELHTNGAFNDTGNTSSSVPRHSASSFSSDRPLLESLADLDIRRPESPRQPSFMEALDRVWHLFNSGKLGNGEDEGRAAIAGPSGAGPSQRRLENTPVERRIMPSLRNAPWRRPIAQTARAPSRRTMRGNLAKYKPYQSDEDFHFLESLNINYSDLDLQKPRKWQWKGLRLRHRDRKKAASL